MTPATLDADLRLSATAHAHREAVIAGETRLTYAELDRRADAFAALLRTRGVRRGDRVAVVLRNSAEAVVSIYGILRAGAVFVPVNPNTRVNKLSQVLGDCGAVSAVCETMSTSLVRTAGERLEHFDDVLDISTVDLAPLAEAGGGPTGDLTGNLDVDLAAIIYTSGSTGVPKGVALLHRNLRFVSSSIVDYLGLTHDDRVLSVLPLSHTYGLGQLLQAVHTGATLVLEHGVTFPGRVVQLLEEEDITVLPGVPTTWQILLSFRGPGSPELPRLRVLTNAGAALSGGRLAQVRAAFPAVRFYSMYGQTECTRACYLAPEALDSRPGSVGKAIPGTEVWIEDDNGDPLPPGVVGELVIRGDHVMQGYWGDATATANKLKGDRLPGDRVMYSGDLFRADDAGYLYFVARKDDIIKSGAEKIAPREVEEVLYEALGVREAAVVGVDDELLGQAVVAHVSLADGHDLDEPRLRRHCASILEPHMVPRRVLIYEHLPKNDAGKLDRLLLASYGQSRPPTVSA